MATNAVSASSRRQYGRIALVHEPIRGTIYLDAVGGRSVEHCSDMSIINIGLGGACFVTSLDFPVRRDYVILIKIETTNPPLHLPAEIVWKSSSTATHQKLYGCKFVDEEAKPFLKWLWFGYNLAQRERLAHPLHVYQDSARWRQGREPVVSDVL